MSANEPSFPIVDVFGKNYSGLTKRELFAAMAMQSIISSDKGFGFSLTALESISYADALLKELEK